MERKKKNKFWLVTVDMGYGHQRASYPLCDSAYGGLINANNYPGIPLKDRKIWTEQRKFYEAVSRFKKVPVIGNIAFEIFDYFQKIPNFYPKRDLSKKSLQLISCFHLLRHNRLGEHLIDKVKTKPKLPFVTPFFLTAYMAEVFEYPGDIYLIICDTDISRAWVDEEPQNTRIKYLVPCQRVVERLELYGVPKENIYLTGFPLPKENLGGENFPILKKDFSHRIVNLDPKRVYLEQYKDTLCKNLGMPFLPRHSDHPLTLTFAVGGAGAQQGIGADILKGLKQKIINKETRVNLIAGIHKGVNKYYKEQIKKYGLEKMFGSYVRILYTPSKEDYFKHFNQWLRTTDILWTKPSELSFYSALGLPIIMAEPIGSQEVFNRHYLINLGAGLEQEDVKYVDEWLFNWLNRGKLAEAAAQGFVEAPKSGTYNIEKILAQHQEQTKKVKTISLY